MKPNCRLRYTVLTAAVALASMAPLVAGALANAPLPKPASGTVAYPFTNFRSGMPGVWNSRPDLHGSVERLAGQTHDGKRIIRLNWDFSAVRDPANNFVNFFWPRRLLGQPLAVKAWIYTPPQGVGASVALWIEDATGQELVSRHTMSRPGWGNYRFPVVGLAAAWKSGAGENDSVFLWVLLLPIRSRLAELWMTDILPNVTAPSSEHHLGRLLHES